MNAYSISLARKHHSGTLRGGCKHESIKFDTTINNNEKQSGKYIHIHCPEGSELLKKEKAYLDPHNKFVEIEPSNALSIKNSVNALELFKQAANSAATSTPTLTELKEGDHVLIELEKSTLQADGCFRGGKLEQHIAKQDGEALSETTMSESEFCPGKTITAPDHTDL